MPALSLVLLLVPVPWAVAAPVVDWKSGDGHRFASLPVPAAGKTGFTSVPSSVTGLHFTNRLTEERGLTNQIYMSGSGVACGDIDGDGWCDLYFCGLDSPNALYRNLGNWKFEDITAKAGVACADQASTGAVFADVDGDGDLDLLVSGLGRGVRLFLNDGKGAFREVTAEAGLRSESASMTMALADIDGDGDLDLYVANYRSDTMQDDPGLRFRVSTTNQLRVITTINERPITPAEAIRYSVRPGDTAIIENGEADALYRNDGHGKFTPLSWTDGTFLDEDGKPLVAPPYDWSYTAMFRDINGDGAPDLYVCGDNDSPDRIWINEGGGRFRALARLAVRQTSLSSMGVDFADLNRDGFDEYVVADMLMVEHSLRHRQLVDRRPLHPVGEIENRPQYARNTLYLNRGDGTYAEIAQFSGLEASDWSWLPVFLDVDLDGYEDLLFTTGLERNLRHADSRRQLNLAKAQQNLSRRQFQEMRKSMPRLETPNRAFHNRGNLTFEEVSAAWGFDSPLVSQGMALADLDNDGDLDVVVNVMNGPALAYRNDTSAPRVALRLRGKPANTRGIGAKLKLLGGAVPTQSQEIICGGRYLSGDDPIRAFAAGSSTNRMRLEVTWRCGTRSVLTNIEANHVYEVNEASASSVAAATNRQSLIANRQSAIATPVFTDVSDLLRHRHDEEPFNDFQRQVLLPKRLSQLGPGVCWADFNSDGLDDLIVGAGRGGELGVFANDGQGGFNRISVVDLTGRLPGDAATVLNIPAPGGTTLLVGISNYETGSTNHPSVVRYEIGAGGVEPRWPLAGHESSVGPMALADVNSDGALDLFVGGRVLAGRYPEAATSRLYRRVGEQFRLDPEQQKTFDKIGLVSGVVFSDLNEDGLPELLLACEWGPLRVFRNVKGNLVEATEELGFGKFVGWWNSVATGDFDGDGRMDIVAGNWGRNSKYQRYIARPLRIFYGDQDGDGTVEIVEVFEDPALRKLVPWRFLDTLGLGLPFVQERYPNFASYSVAGVDEILGPRKNTMQELTANTLDSMLFLNRGDHFEARPLPFEAQLSPAFSLNVGDLDGDGNEDLFVSQNFFGVDPETSRYDAGRGLWLRGDGQGNFRPVPATESGVMIYGEQRGAALGDYDGDGRVDLVVTQNGAATKLYHNLGARPGLRVRLAGPPGNPAGFGAVLRLVSGGKSGPAREVRAGSGYWSQDSAVQVLALPGGPARLQVRWPGGGVVTAEVPPGAREVTMDLNGRLTAVK